MQNPFMTYGSYEVHVSFTIILEKSRIFNENIVGREVLTCAKHLHAVVIKHGGEVNMLGPCLKYFVLNCSPFIFL